MIVNALMVLLDPTVILKSMNVTQTRVFMVNVQMPMQRLDVHVSLDMKGLTAR